MPPRTRVGFMSVFDASFLVCQSNESVKVAYLNGMTIQMKATEQYFSVLLLVMLYKGILTFESANEIPKCDIQMTTIEQYFSVRRRFSLLCWWIKSSNVHVTLHLKATQQCFPVLEYIFLTK